MALAFDHEIGSNTGTAVTTLAVTAGAAVAQFDLIVFVLAGTLTATLSSVSDSKGNTYTVVQNIGNIGNGSIGMAFASAVTALANTDTITGNFSSSENVAIEACCFSGFTNHNPTSDQVSAEAHGTSTTPASANVTTTVAAEVAVGGICTINSPGSVTAGGSFTKTAATPIINGTVVALSVIWQILASTQTLNAGVTDAQSRAWEAGLCTFYDQAAAAAGRERGLLGVGS